MKRIIIIVMIITSIDSYCQSTNKNYFKDSGFSCIENVSKKMFQAYANGDLEEYKSFQKILINNCVKGKYFSNYQFKTYDKKIIRISKIQKRIFLMISRISNNDIMDQIDIINYLVNKFDNEFEFIILFSEKKNAIKKIAKKYDKRIHLIPVEKKIGAYDEILYFDGFKHFIGFPAIYLIDIDRKINDLILGASLQPSSLSKEKVYSNNLDILISSMNQLVY